MSADFSQSSDIELLRLYADVMKELRARGVVRSANNPVADYTEKLVAGRLGLVLVGKSSKGHDAVDSKGDRYQIKGRRITPENSSTQLSAIRDLTERPFDHLIGVVFRADFSVDYAGIVPGVVVKQLAAFVPRTNSHRFLMRRSVLDVASVRDISRQLTIASA